MKLDPQRQIFKPPLDADRRELIARLLKTVSISLLVVVTLVFLARQIKLGFLLDATSILLIGLFVFQVLLLILVLRGYVTQTTERSRTEQALLIGQERFTKILHGSPVAISITSLKEGTLLEANQAYWRLTDLDPATAIGRTAVELKVWDTEDLRQKFTDQLIRQKSLHDVKHEFMHQNGEKRLALAFFELIDSGDEPSILSIFYDITDRMQAQDALHRSDERFRKVFQVSPVAIVITTLEEGRIIDANEAYWKLSGYDPKSSIGRTALELREGYQVETRAAFVRELLDKKSIQNPNYDFVNQKGVYLKTIAFHELIEDAGHAAILSMFYDMTEQSNVQQALIQSEERVRALLKAAPDTIFELTRAGRIVQFIPSADNDLALQADELIGKNIAQVFPAIAEQTNFAIGRALDSGQVNAFEYQLPDGEEAQKDFEARITPAGPDLVLATIRNVSLRKWAESEREKLINELEAKNAELERFTYTVSHDLKSPLITMKGFLGYVREDVRMGKMERFEVDLQRIGDAAEKMQHLLGDLLDLSRIGRVTNKPEYISMNDLISQAINLLQERLNNKNIFVYVADNLPVVYGDRVRILEVFQNLIDNAAKFMGNQPAPRIDIGVQGVLNESPIFYVRDNGIGIAPQFKDKIYGLFDKLNAQTEGTGIGLALVKRIIEFHGGKIWVESEVGMGATFFFTFPLSEK